MNNSLERKHSLLVDHVERGVYYDIGIKNYNLSSILDHASSDHFDVEPSQGSRPARLADLKFQSQAVQSQWRCGNTVPLGRCVPTGASSSPRVANRYADRTPCEEGHSVLSMPQAYQEISV